MPAADTPPHLAPVTGSGAPLAPRWHTLALVALQVSVAAAGLWLTHAGGGVPAAPVAPAPWASRLVSVYLPMVIVQVGLVIYVARVGRPQSALGALIGRRWGTPARAAVDVALGLLAWLLILGGEVAWARWSRVTTATSVTAMLPHTWPERLAWVVVASIVGFSEEVVYRGYLQTQLTAFTRSALAGIVLQAALFGLAHGEQGPAVMVRFALYGLGFGALARWRQSLLPGVVGHVWTDAASGLLRP
ncbi:MAG: CPBP family intramembrane metalloprotease [Myxococcales bacterium]|nr:MAG: CPBP family intramembrane metalloprotease [Myxococcales bacterium]